MAECSVTWKQIAPDHELLQYMGRVDFDKVDGPEFVFPCTFVKMKFKGTDCKVSLTNTHGYWTNYMGYFVDGKQKVFELPDQGTKEYILAENLPNTVHEIMLFKRQDSCHTVQFHGFSVDEGAELLPLDPLPERRIEVYGDSVSAGEVSEAVEYVGLADPQHHGEFSNSYYSYSWMTARKLHAQIHDIAQGGIALLDDTGWYEGPDYKGMMSLAYDRIEYSPSFGVQKRWDFKRYTPDVVIVALGQNDANPEDFMKLDYEGEKAVYWRMSYERFVLRLRSIYPHAHIILATTILGHDPNWDRAIDDVCKKLNARDEKIHHFLYTNNGCGTAGHIRIPEAEKMSDELAAYIEGLHAFA